MHTTTGPERTLFVSDMNSPPSAVDVCGGSGAIVFVWPFRNNSTTQNVWRINADGTQPQQLTDFRVASVPACSPDGNWVAFMAESTIFRMRTSGGSAERLAPTVSLGNIDWSPDGKLLAVMTAMREKDGGLIRTLQLITPGAASPGCSRPPTPSALSGSHLMDPPSPIACANTASTAFKSGRSTARHAASS